MGFPAVRLTACALDVVLSVRRRYHLYELYFATEGSQTIKHTVKYTKYTFANRRTPRHALIADMLLGLIGGAICQHCASCHVTAISYVYTTRKTSSFFRMSYCLKALIFGNISSASDSVDGVLIII